MTDDFEEKGNLFLQWLKDNGATLSDGIAFKDYRASEDAGRGVVATRQIQEGEVLFTIPRKLLLSSQSSALRQHDGMGQVLDGMTGWSPLILCLMYESQRPDSFWKPYFDILPKEFSTPMFWSPEELKELQGTGVIDKIGKEQAESMFHEVIEPVIKDHPELFDSAMHNASLFHVCGSLIMAYSFHDELNPLKQNKEEDDEEEEEEEEEGLLAMVPMADMLNHKTGYNNARLFHEPDGLHMKAIKTIQEGEQIYNTYGELCNADLLRKYGFADENNPFDLCELYGDEVVRLCCQDTEEELRDKKIEFLMEEGVLDDYFVIDMEHELPPELISTIHVLRASAADFAQMESKQKLPKPKLTPQIMSVGIELLQKRLERYPTSLKDDLEELDTCKKSNDSNNRNKRHALLVRIGEKQIIQATIDKLRKAGSKRPAGESADPEKAKKREKKH